MIGAGESEVISHAPATSRIQVATFATTEPIHSERKTGR